MNHPHELASLLLAMGRAGVELGPHPSDPERLRHRPAPLPPALAGRLRMSKAGILALLGEGYTPEPDSDAGHVYAERLGMADGLGMATAPGSPGWMIAVAESMGDSCSPTTMVVHCGHGKTCGCDSPGG